MFNIKIFVPLKKKAGSNFELNVVSDNSEKKEQYFELVMMMVEEDRELTIE